MAGEFRGAVVTRGTVSGNSGSDIFGVTMPADVQAGDYLFVMFGGPFDLRVIDFDSDGTWTNIGSSDSHAKIASGSEGGATVNFESYAGPFGGTRPVTAIALCYRFPYTPTTGGLYLGGTLRELGTRHFSDPLPTDSFDSGGQFGGNVGAGRSEFRIYHCEAATSDVSNSYDATTMTWSGDLITDRTGVLASVGGSSPTGIDAGSDSVADAFYLSIASTGSTHDTKIVINGPGTDGGGFLEGWAIFFPEIVQAPYWGILAAPG